MKKSVLVTGGCGFIGSHLVDRLVAEGRRVRVVDNLTEQVHGGRKPDYLNDSVEYRFEDVNDRAVLRAALEGMDAVVHLAAAVGVGQSMYEPYEYVRTNTLATTGLLQELIDTSERPARLVIASSMSVYGEGAFVCSSCGPARAERGRGALEAGDWEPRCPACDGVLAPEPTSESKAVEPASVYAQTKLDQEILCLSIGRAYALPTVALRFFNVYGPRQSLSNPYTGVAAIFSSRLQNGQPPVVFEDGGQLRDFVHVGDIVAACWLALTHPGTDYRTLNVGSGAPVTIGDLARLLIRVHGREGEIEPEIPGSFRAGDIRHCFADITALQELGYRPRMALEEGMRELVEWSRAVEAEDHFDEARRELARRGLL